MEIRRTFILTKQNTLHTSKRQTVSDCVCVCMCTYVFDQNNFLHFFRNWKITLLPHTRYNYVTTDADRTHFYHYMLQSPATLCKSCSSSSTYHVHSDAAAVYVVMSLMPGMCQRKHVYFVRNFYKKLF